MQFQKKKHTHPIEGHRKFLGGGGGVYKPKFNKQSMKLNWNFLKWKGGGGGEGAK